MSRKSQRGGNAAPHDSAAEATDDLLDEADSIYLPLQEEVHAPPMPNSIAPGKAWVDEYYGQHHDAQPELYGADGELASRPLKAKAAESVAQATVAKKLIEDAEVELDAASSAYLHAEEHLRPHVRRAKGATVLYYGGMATMVLGDLGGIAQPQVTYGEMPSLAVVQGASAAVGMVMSGWTGRVLKDHHDAVKRIEDPDDLKATELERYGHLFRNPGPLQRSAFAASAVIFAAAPLAVCLLRTSVDGSLWGISFALFAMIACAASFVGTYFYTDGICDLLAGYAKRRKQAIKALKALAKDRSIKIVACSLATASSIEAEATRRGLAAQSHTKALPAKVKMNNGHVFGVGEAAPTEAQCSFFTPADLAHLAKLNGQTNGHSNGSVRS